MYLLSVKFSIFCKLNITLVTDQTNKKLNNKKQTLGGTTGDGPLTSIGVKSVIPKECL